MEWNSLPELSLFYQRATLFAKAKGLKDWQILQKNFDRMK